MKKGFFIPVVLLSCFLSSTLHAQKATFSRFSLACRDVDWQGHKEYVMWEDNYSNEFVYVNDKNVKFAIRTVDTLFSYAQQAVSRKLGIPAMEEQVPDGDVAQGPLGEMTGFPNKRMKDVLRDGKFDKIIDVAVMASPEQNDRIVIASASNKKYQVQMTVIIKVYDRSGAEIERYKGSAKLDEPKKVKGAAKNPLSGNEFFDLFVKAMDNALANQRK